MTQSFTYDGFGGLASEARDSTWTGYGPALESYTYDAAGNRNQAGYSYAVTNAVRGRPATIQQDPAEFRRKFRGLRQMSEAARRP